MSIAQAKAYLLLALGELAKEDPAPEPPPPPPPPAEPPPGPVTDGDTLGDYGELRKPLPYSCRGFFTQRGYILVQAMAGGAGAIGTYYRMDGGPLTPGPEVWPIEPGRHDFTFTGGKAGVVYSIRWFPR